MCVAVVVPAGKKLDPKEAWKCWLNNSDGGGFSYVNDNHEVVTEKGFAKYADFWKAYQKAADKNSDISPFLLHFRIGTVGDKTSAENTHPFAFKPDEGPEGVMMHNGTLSYELDDLRGPNNDRRSDTRAFVEALGPKLNYEDVSLMKKAIEKIVDYNKLAFLWGNRKYVIVNEAGGAWIDGIWYSNTLHCHLRGN